MSRQQFFLGIGLLSILILWLALPLGRRNIDIPNVQVVVLDPFEQPILQDYRRYRDAVIAGDTEALEALLPEVQGSFLEYRTLLTLARSEEIDAAQRTLYLKRALDVRIHDPLADVETRALYLELAKTAEAAGLNQLAIDAYVEALPEAQAFAGLRRLEQNPYNLANIFLQANQYRNALEALGELAAPSIEAPAHRALGEHEKGLEAYERWLAEVPSSSAAELGRAWSLFYLGHNEAAEAAFRELPGSTGFYGRGLLARRAGNLNQAVSLMKRSGEPYHLWLVTNWLEAEERYADVLPIYLTLAEGNSRYAADAAYRAYVLADRLGNAVVMTRAKDLLPAFSHFGQLLGKPLELPQTSTLPEVTPEVLELADALMQVNDREAAIGELEFALRNAEDEATTVAIAEKLQRLGEFRQSQQAAERWLEAGSRDLRTWQLAYPRAYPDIVASATSKWNIDPALVWAVMRQESRFYPQALSYSGAKGLMQFMPATWDEMARRLDEPPGNPFDPADNIRYGTYYLRWLLDYLGGDIERAIPAYNGGPGYIKRLYNGPVVNENKADFYRFIDKPQTRDYLQKVMLNYQVYSALYDEQVATKAD